MQKFVLSGNVLQAVGEYLAARPYKEVAGLIQAISSAEPLAETETPKANKTTPGSQEGA